MRFEKLLLPILLCFFAMTMPLAFDRVTGGRSAQKQADTAATIRMYCEDPSLSPFARPVANYGRNPFNLELPFLEWAQGSISRTLDRECDSVEAVSKTMSVLSGALGIVALFLLSSTLFGPIGACFSAFALATDAFWLRYSTYTMIEGRTLAFALLAIWCAFRSRFLPAFLFWALCFVSKPQFFVYFSALWLALETYRARSVRGGLRRLCHPMNLLSYGAACLLGVAWILWSEKVNLSSDLPWIVQTGPWKRKWYFGNFADRLTFDYFKALLVHWLRDSGLNVVLPALAVGFVFARRKGYFLEALRRAAPFLFATGVYTFIFYPVFIAHEYYALPLNVGRALTTGSLLALLSEFVIEVAGLRAWLKFCLIATVAVVLGHGAFVGLRAYSKFALHIRDPQTDFYHPSWDAPVFPKKHSFVVMAAPGAGYEILHLYLAKQKGFSWCSQNKEFAPRAFWKSQGVEFVAWTEGAIDPKTNGLKWEVRSMAEELELARKMGWSSDVNDAWAGKTMAEWTAIAAQKQKDVCNNLGDRNPGTW